MGSSLINVAKLVDLTSTERNQYSYTRMKNIMSGAVKRTRKSEIQKIRKILKTEFDSVDTMLAKLEEKAY
jgi:hypothetical protein